MKSTPLDDFKDLIIKYFTGKCNDEEKLKMCHVLLIPENELKVKEILLQHLSEFNQDNEQNVEFDHIYKRIINEIQNNEKIEERRLKFVRRAKIFRLAKSFSKAAAIFILAFIIGVIYMHYSNSVSILNTKSLSYCEINAPLGAKADIVLPDGSQVLLNAGSKIKYYSDFNIKNRHLLLEGEAYFKVAKNKRIPLIVSVSNINIRAVGTEFNVKAYLNEGTIETTLIKGLVEISKNGSKENQVEKISLTPNQKALYVKEDDKLAIYKADIKEKEKHEAKIAPKEFYIKPIISDNIDIAPIISWTQDQLMFRSETLENICIKLNRKYDVTFKFENEEVKNLRFTGTLEDETIEQVLNVIKSISPIDYTINKKAIVIRENIKQASRYLEFMRNKKNNSLNK